MVIGECAKDTQFKFISLNLTKGSNHDFEIRLEKDTHTKSQRTVNSPQAPASSEDFESIQKKYTKSFDGVPFFLGKGNR